jgi:hypothetical protein
VIWRKIVPTFIVGCWVLASAASSPEILVGHSTQVVASTAARTETFEQTVIPITVFRAGVGVEGKFGTGFCLDPACQFIGTNYHVAMAARPHRIEGEKVVHRHLATGPDDEGATVNDGPAGSLDLVTTRTSSMKYTWHRDLAIFELQHPLREHHGIAFSLQDLQEGQEVDIYTYPKGPINPIRKLLQFRGAYKGETTTGLLAFDYRLSGNNSIRPGSSGGIVVDRKSQQIVGILNGMAKDSEATVSAVPVQSLADFVTKVEPYLAQSLFPSSQGISPVSADLYAKYVPLHADTLEHRAEEPPELKVLRSKAQALADSTRNFIAVQTFVWGSGDNEPAAQAAYEVRVVDGSQKFRLYPKGKKELEEIPSPPLKHYIVPGGEWSELPELVGTELRLKVHQAADATVNDNRIKVFQYSAGIEDAVCAFKYLLGRGASKSVRVACYGEVWTDQDTNIVRMSEHYERPGEPHLYYVVVTYGWLQRADELPRLIPLTISAETEDKKRVSWCRGQFMDYQVFSSRVRIIANK